MSETLSPAIRDPRTVTLEVPEAWFRNAQDGNQHQAFYSTLLAALAEMNVLIEPVWLPRGAERAPRNVSSDRMLISFHSHGEAGNLLRCKESYIPPFYTMDRMGYSCFSELALFPDRFYDEISRQDEDESKAFLADLGRELRRSNLSKYSQPPRCGDRIADAYVFVPLQMTNDSVTHGTWLEIRAALDCIVAAASARGLKTVIKRHPRCKDRGISRALDLLDQNPNVIISEKSIYDLIPNAEVVVGANSGVLFESLMQDRPVISFASSDFGIAVQQVNSYEELSAAIAHPDPPSPAWRQKFLFWYLCQYCVRSDSVFQVRHKIQSFRRSEKLRRRRYGIHRFKSAHLFVYSIVDRIKKRLF
ncbi:hypothetical protein [Tateyamaria sp. syn59]|uniref:hypothetical protein n=1 Tax=Tateyamaria sp. syn59 TaxID=2576942 RepID=UPI0011BF69B1|nr:hypothetical protein [Tateyamaria sp. syn59]